MPNYATTGHPVFYLGSGILSDQGYSANTALIAGNPNGAPETPLWEFAAGSSFGTIVCGGGGQTCSEPVFTATQRSATCLDYSVVLNTSYSGFLSDSFWMFINGPNNTEAATCGTSEPSCPPGTWNWTFAVENGYASWVFYSTDTLCALDGPMSGYNMDESFGTWTKSPSLPLVTWTPPTADSWSASGTVWVDMMGFICPADNCVPMPENPPAGCWPACGTTEVQGGPQTFYVGGLSPGAGYAVQTDTQQRWLDHASHENIVTPVPQ